jgi:hypothetical protein
MRGVEAVKVDEPVALQRSTSLTGPVERFEGQAEGLLLVVIEDVAGVDAAP